MAFEIIVIGTSTGGLKALQAILSGLPAEFSLPVVIAQHRGKDLDSGLGEFLAECSRLPVNEPHGKEPTLGGDIFLAPPRYHLLFENCSFALLNAQLVCFA